MYHFVWVINDYNWKIYINGNNIPLSSDNAIINLIDKNVIYDQSYLGKNIFDQNALNFTGYIHDFVIYNKALTHEEVKNINNLQYIEETISDIILNPYVYIPLNYSQAQNTFLNIGSSSSSINVSSFGNPITVNTYNSQNYILYLNGIDQYLKLSSFQPSSKEIKFSLWVSFD